jgi:hypothetical protein
MEVITGNHRTIDYAAVGYPISVVMEVTKLRRMRSECVSSQASSRRSLSAAT